MDKNISQSNAKLRQQSAPQSETKINVKTSNKIAPDTASSKDQGISTIGSENQHLKKSTDTYLKTATKPRASFEGYMQAPTAYIQVNNYGYDNKANQQARNQKLSKRNIIQEFSQKNINLQSRFSNNGIINNYTKCSLNNSSKSILDKSLKLNKLF